MLDMILAMRVSRKTQNGISKMESIMYIYIYDMISFDWKYLDPRYIVSNFGIAGHALCNA